MNLFADDIILMAPTTTDMQLLLSVCEEFARRNGLTSGITKCHALAASEDIQAPLVLDGQELAYVPSADYLGVNISGEGITDVATIERLCSAGARLRQLKASGIRRPKMGIERLRKVYGALVRPVWTYALYTRHEPQIGASAGSLLTAQQHGGSWATSSTKRSTSASGQPLLR